MKRTSSIRFIGLLLISVLLSFSVSAAINETGDTTAIITSSTPSILSIELNDITTGDDTIILNAGTTRAVNCWGSATDSDGLADIKNLTAVIYSENSSEFAANLDDNHYTNYSCNYDNSTGDYNCGFADMEFYAENGTWTCTVNVTDFAGNSNKTSDTATVAQLLAIDIPDASVVDFGSVGVGQASSEQSVNYENEGNVAIDVEVDVYRDNNDTADSEAMNCTTGNIPATNVNASLTSGASYSALQAATILSLNADLAEATGNDQSPTSDTVYLNVLLPAGGVGGDCDGTIFFGATLS